MEEQKIKAAKILTDVVSDYWIVMLEVEVGTLADFENRRGFTSQPKVQEIMKNYLNLVMGGKREIFNIE